MSYEKFCSLTFLACLSTYSYFLLATVVINYNQLGLKLLAPILAMGLIGAEYEAFYAVVNIKKYVYFSPIGWLTSISSYRLMPMQYLLNTT